VTQKLSPLDSVMPDAFVAESKKIVASPASSASPSWFRSANRRIWSLFTSLANTTPFGPVCIDWTFGIATGPSAAS